jgi:hypothetical protein
MVDRNREAEDIMHLTTFQRLQTFSPHIAELFSKYTSNPDKQVAAGSQNASRTRIRRNQNKFAAVFTWVCLSAAVSIPSLTVAARADVLIGADQVSENRANGGASLWGAVGTAGDTMDAIDITVTANALYSDAAGNDGVQGTSCPNPLSDPNVSIANLALGFTAGTGQSDLGDFLHGVNNASCSSGASASYADYAMKGPGLAPSIVEAVNVYSYYATSIATNTGITQISASRTGLIYLSLCLAAVGVALFGLTSIPWVLYLNRGRV